MASKYLDKSSGNYVWLTADIASGVNIGLNGQIYNFINNGDNYIDPNTGVFITSVSGPVLTSYTVTDTTDANGTYIEDGVYVGANGTYPKYKQDGGSLYIWMNDSNGYGDGNWNLNDTPGVDLPLYYAPVTEPPSLVPIEGTWDVAFGASANATVTKD